MISIGFVVNRQMSDRVKKTRSGIESTAFSFLVLCLVHEQFLGPVFSLDYYNGFMEPKFDIFPSCVCISGRQTMGNV